LDGARILLVEDDEVLGDLVYRNLEARGHEVRIAEDAQKALAFLRAATYDLILLDINLPDQTGWDVLRGALSEGNIKPVMLEGQGEKLPVVILSAVRVGAGRLAEFHPLAYLPKPFPMDALLRLAAEAGLLPKAVKNLLYLSSRSLMRRNYMLDLIVVVVTLVSFLVLIGFTEGCERL
jgi:CheY-like chemotaxis protein